MKSLKTIIFGVLFVLTSVLAASCQKEEHGKPIKATIEIEELVEVEAVGGIVEIKLKSSYPWFASTNVDWFKVTKYRGQMKLDEKIIIDVTPNTSTESREAILQIKLMDQLTKDITIRQKGI